MLTMKLQFNTVESNLKNLKEELIIYDEACTRNDSILLSQSTKRINEITLALRRSIRNGDWYSDELVMLNGASHQNPVTFYIVFNKEY